MKGQRTFADVYVPYALRNTTVNFNITDACDGSAIDGLGVTNSFGYTADTQYTILGSGHVIASSDRPNGLPNCLNLNYSFVANPAWATLSDNGDYYVFRLFAQAIPKAADGNSYYRNLFRLTSTDPGNSSGIQFGISSTPRACPWATYKYSCPTPLFGTSYSFSSFFQPGSGPYSQKIVLRTGCTDSYTGGVLLYDLDSGNYSQTDIRARIATTDASGNTTYLPNASGYALSSPTFAGANGNDQYLITPTYTFLPNKTYTFEIWGLNQQNTLQILPFMGQSGAPTDCGTAPSGSLSLTCDTAGTVTIGASANDADSQVVRLVGTIPANATRNNTAVQITAGSVRTIAGGPAEILAGIAPSSFPGKIDGISHSITLTLVDSLNLSTPITASYTCFQQVDADFTLSCDVNPITSIEPGDTYYPRIRIIRTGGSTDTYTLRVNMSITNNSATRTVTSYSSTADGTVVFQDSGDGNNTGIGITKAFFTNSNDGITFTTPQEYTLTYTWSSTDSSNTVTQGRACEEVVSVQNKPYFKVVGGDIFSGGNNSVIRGFNKNGRTYTGASAVNDTSGKSGAGVQGVIASSTVIDGVASGIFQSLLPALKPLTFANNVNADTYGGNFGNVPYTLPSIDSTAISYIAGASTNGSFTYTGDLSYSNTNVANGTHFTLYVQGDLTIDNNIVYAGSGSYASISDIPHVKLIVLRNGANGGNVRINPNVSRIDAEIISAGTIDTCYTTAANKFTACNNNLVVHGSLTGSYISLNRLAGTLRASRATDGLFGGCAAPTNATLGYCNMPNIGELIVHTPESYLSIPGERPEVPQGNKYDSITALPPLF